MLPNNRLARLSGVVQMSYVASGGDRTAGRVQRRAEPSGRSARRCTELAYGRQNGAAPSPYETGETDS